MARAKSGGTSAKLRGVVGDYIYQVIRNPQGDTEQKVITYTKEKLNRNTRYQALARMQIAMFMRCMNLLTPIISDSYQGIRSRVNSCNRFVELNMKNIQDYCALHWKESLNCSFPIKGNTQETFFPFIISEGSYEVPSLFRVGDLQSSDDYPAFEFDLSRTAGRKLDLMKALGFATGDSINFVYWLDGGKSVGIVSVQLATMFNDYTYITASNAKNLFSAKLSMLNGSTRLSYSVQLNTSFDTATKRLTLRPIVRFTSSAGTYTMPCMMYSFIFSKRKGNTWLRNSNWFRVLSPDGEPWDFGNPPSEAYYTWDENYDDEDYEDYFG